MKPSPVHRCCLPIVAMMIARISRMNVGALIPPPSPMKSNTRQLSIHQLFVSLSEEDQQFLELAVQHARNGLGHTFPNPAVGCVVVQDSRVVGAGFHPRAGLPHAEVFALLQAAGHVADGVASAKAMIDRSDLTLVEQITQLSEQYLTEAGPAELIGGTFADQKAGTGATAYVTLEPCCHHGKTPPCAVSLALAGVSRVVIGLRDPNPRVNGGGYRVLEDAGIQVLEADGPIRESCTSLVTNFLKRITPRHDNATDYSNINGAMRRALRALGGRMKVEKTLVVHHWDGPKIEEDTERDFVNVINQLPMNASWLEQVDSALWDHELILLRLNSAVSKKKGAKALAERIAKQLDAHIAQVMGHTALLYRPAIPPVLDLVKLSQGI